jgi:hypothetical protein
LLQQFSEERTDVGIVLDDHRPAIVLAHSAAGYRLAESGAYLK